MITEVTASPVVYQGSKVPVEVSYRAVGVQGESFDLVLKSADGSVLGRQTIHPETQFSEGKVSLDVLVERPGRQQFKVELPVLAGELTADNNRRTFYLNVLANRMRVLVVAGPPDNGLGDLIRRLGTDEHIQVVQRTTHGGGFLEGDWPDEKLLSETDVVVLHHFPTRQSSAGQVEAFASAIEKRNLPVCMIDGDAVDLNLLRSFQASLPVVPKGGEPRLLTSQVEPLRRHAIIAEPEDANFTAKWTGLPPVGFGAGAFEALPQSEVLAEFEPGGTVRYPAIIVAEKGGTKSAALLMRDLWRWGLSSPGSDGVTEPLLGRLIRWLAVRKSEKRVQISFAKEQFSTQESVGLTATVYDENYQPFDGAEVQGEVSSVGRQGTRLTLTGEGKGRYRTSFPPWGEGEYKVVVRAQKDAVKLGEDSGSVVVEPFSIELLDSRLNEPLLRQISETSGARYAPADSAGELLKGISLPEEVIHEEKRHDLWGGWWHLGLVVICLGMEWFLRVRLGML